MHPHLFDHLQYRQEKHHLSWHILKRNVNEEVKNWTIYRIFFYPFYGHDYGVSRLLRSEITSMLTKWL